MVDFAGLAVFVAIADARSFSTAADRLGIAQSVASKRLKRLEDVLGTRLFDRRVRADIRLTRAGALLLPEARELLAGLDRVGRMGRDLGRGSRGPLNIGFVFSAALSGALARILTAVRTELPAIDLRPRLMETPEQLAALHACRLDMALVRPRPSYPAGCQAVDFHAEELVVCLSDGDALATHAALAPAQLAGARFIVPQFHEDVGLIDNIRRLAAAGGFALPPVVRTDDFVTAACLAAAGAGVVVAPASLARLGLAGMCCRPLTGFAERLRTVLVWRDDAPRAAVDTVLALVP